MILVKVNQVKKSFKATLIMKQSLN